MPWHVRPRKTLPKCKQLKSQNANIHRTDMPWHVPTVMIKNFKKQNERRNRGNPV
jgi:hypothetical protein